MKITILALLFASMTISYARIGDSEKQLIDRYGDPISKEDDGRVKVETYEKDSFKITVVLLDDKSVHDIYTKTNHGNMSVEEQNAIVAKEGAGMNISDRMETSYGTAWYNGEILFAMFDAGSLSVSTAGMHEAQPIMMKARAEKSTSGL